MTKTTLTKICLAVASSCAAAALSAIPASAATGSATGAPGTGLIGGCNMLNDPSMFSVAMAHASAQGDNGMFIGVAASGDPYCQTSLGG
jgi:hypothetical protein